MDLRGDFPGSRGNCFGGYAVKSLAGVLCVFLLLASMLGATVSTAAEDWETWPKKPADMTPEEEAAASAGAEGGKKTFGGISAGTIGWIAAIGGGILVIAIAAGGGGGGSSTPPSH
jgi:hypothetical protein